MALHISLRTQIETLLHSQPIVLFMKGTRQQPRCGYSATVVRILNEMGVAYRDVDVLVDPTLREGIKEYGQWPTLPQLYVNGNLIGGSDIVQELFQRGELAAALGTPTRAMQTFAPTPTNQAYDVVSIQKPIRIRQMTVQELKQKLDTGEPLRLYDVRTQAERQVAQIPQAVWWTDQARAELETLPKDTPIAFHCHHGGRSQAAAEQFFQQGFRNVCNIQGGIDAWSLQIDPAVKRY